MMMRAHGDAVANGLTLVALLARVNLAGGGCGTHSGRGEENGAEDNGELHVENCLVVLMYGYFGKAEMEMEISLVFAD